ncbi:MAG: CPBP family intramembrane metalloprotease [Verrucomicrobiota bacterium]|nr:CPBP family intramembrane metalloprotease [Verrucomicrobiota bacterium]
MRPLRAVVIYLGAVFIGGALLAPWLCWLARDFAPAFPRIAGAPFNRFVDRSLLLAALAGLWPLLRALDARSWRDLGLVQPYGQSGKFFGGLLVGFLSLAAVAGTALACGDRLAAPNLTAHKIVGSVFSAVATAVVVAGLEEVLFRGGIFGGLRRVLYWPFALVISSLVYALVHFLRRADFAGPVAWNSGLVLLPRMLAGFADLRALVPAFLTLTLAGVLLGLAYQRSGNLYFSMGLHAGWIFWLKIYGALTVADAGAHAWFWGTSRLIDGWLAFLALACVLGLFKFLPLGEKRSPYMISK